MSYGYPYRFSDQFKDSIDLHLIGNEAYEARLAPQYRRRSLTPVDALMTQTNVLWAVVNQASILAYLSD